MVTKKIYQDDTASSSTERWSYKLPRRKKYSRLLGIAIANISIARGTLPASARIEPSGQLEEFIDRVSAGGGAPVPLFQIQGDPHGAGFISQLPPRKHEATHRYGFQFGHEQSHEKSWWWIILDDSGTRPRMTAVEFAPELSGKVTITAPAQTCTAETQTGLFVDALARPYQDPERQGRGV
jgi:hypothetical protein